MSGWQYQHPDGRISSPVSAQQLSRMIESGELGIDTPVCHHVKTNGSWIKAISMAMNSTRQNATLDLCSNESVRRSTSAATEARGVPTRVLMLAKTPSLLRILISFVYRFQRPIVATCLSCLTVAILGAAMHFGGQFVHEFASASAPEDDSAEQRVPNLDTNGPTEAPTEDQRTDEERQGTSSKRNVAASENATSRQAAGKPTINSVDKNGSPQQADSNSDRPSSHTPTLSFTSTKSEAPSEKPETLTIEPPQTVQVRGRRLKHLMKKGDLLPAELANRTGIDVRQINRVLGSTSAEVHLHIAKRLVAEFNVDLDSL